MSCRPTLPCIRNAAACGVPLARAVHVQSVWAHMLGAVCLGFFWQQMNFVGHDTAIGLFVGNMCTGVSMGA